MSNKPTKGYTLPTATGPLTEDDLDEDFKMGISDGSYPPGTFDDLKARIKADADKAKKQKKMLADARALVER